MTNQDATAILIAGMHRSGTSALAGALGKLGIPLGERLLEPGGDNPKGYWEHRDIVAVHERLLTALGSRWDDVRALPPDWLRSDPARQAATAIDGLVARDFAGTPLWAVKDPRLCRFLPLWLEVLPRKNVRPVVLLMARKPSEVAASIEARNDWHSPIGEMLWLRYMTEAEAASRGLPRSVVVYDDLVATPVSAVSIALKALGIAFSLSPTHAREVLAGFIDKADQHHVHGSTGKPSTEFAAIAQTIYTSLTSIAQGNDAWKAVQKSAAEFKKHWQHEAGAIDALADMAMKRSLDAESEWVENKMLSSKLTAQIRWSDEAQANREALQAENAELQSKLNAQIRWSDEAQANREALQAEIAELQSKLNAQIRWSDEAQANRKALQAEIAELQSKLNAQIRWSDEAKTKQEALQATCDELLRDKQNRDHLASELQRVKAEAEQAQNKLAASLQETVASRDHLASELQQATDKASSLAVMLASIESSLSWKLMRPFRETAKTLKRIRGRS